MVTNEFVSNALYGCGLSNWLKLGSGSPVNFSAPQIALVGRVLPTLTLTGMVLLKQELTMVRALKLFMILATSKVGLRISIHSIFTISD